MTTVRQRREAIEKAPFTFDNPPPPEELDVFIVTNRLTRAKVDEDSGATVAETKTEANIQEREADIKQILRLQGVGDDRVKATRIFELNVDDDGVPTIGAERS